MTLPGDHPALENAAIWLRRHLGVPNNETIFEPFEQYFRCELKFSRDRRNDPWYTPDLAIFDSEQDLTMFLLRWT